MMKANVQIQRINYGRMLILLVLFNLVSFSIQAQDESESGKKGFKKEKLFTGGSLNLAFGSQFTALGINPYFGYSLNKFLDVAVTANLNYTSERDYILLGDKVRQTVYGPGMFVRVFPVKFLFAQAQFEHNFMQLKYIPAPNSSYLREKYKVDANSLLVGGGYCSGRGEGSNSFFYFSVLWDVGKAENSPYLDNLRRAVPQIRAGYNIALFQGGGRRGF